MTVLYGKVMWVSGQRAKRKCLLSDIRNCLLGLNSGFWPSAVMCWSETQIAGVSLSWKKRKHPGATAGCSAGFPLQPFSCPDNQPGRHLLLVPSLHRGKHTLMTKSISCSSVPLGGLSFTWILCVMVQNHLQESHLLLTAALTFHPMLGLWYQCVGRGLSLI